MKLIGVKEFASQSSWKELSASLLVHDYTCNGCLSTTDVDLCRDPSLQSEEPSCQHCHTEYDMELIERRLIAMLQNLVDSYGFVAHGTSLDSCSLLSTLLTRFVRHQFAGTW